MFERFSEGARRVIFFARHEAGKLGSLAIEPEHLMLAVLREDRNLPARFLDDPSIAPKIAADLRSGNEVGPEISPGLDLALSEVSQRILRHAVEETERLNTRNVGVEHIVFGILREPDCVAAQVLQKYALNLSMMRARLAKEIGWKSPESSLLSHFLATLAYRVQRALKDAPEGFANFEAGADVRTPHQLICHLINVLGYAHWIFTRELFPPHAATTFEADIDAFYGTLESIKTELEKPDAFQSISPERLLQGPLSGAITHAGQLALLRRLAGSPIPSENYLHAPIRADNLTRDQP